MGFKVSHPCGLRERKTTRQKAKNKKQRGKRDTERERERKRLIEID